MKKLAYNILKYLLVIVYPFVVFWALNKGFSPRYLAVLLATIVAVQFGFQKIRMIRYVALFLSTALISCLWVYNDDLFLKLYPVMVNIVMLIIFGLSLKYSPSIIERFARRGKDDLPDHTILYCRILTIVWCGFFITNATVALGTTFLSLELWTLYNGIISYILIGGLLAGEVLFRIQYIKRRAKYGT